MQTDFQNSFTDGFQGNSLGNYCRAFNLTLTVLLHYLAKNQKFKIAAEQKFSRYFKLYSYYQNNQFYLKVNKT